MTWGRTQPRVGGQGGPCAALPQHRIPREELFVTTKLWVQDAGEENTRRAFETSLRNLGLDVLDLYLIHQPFGDYYSEWRAMEALHTEGRIRAIGVSNFMPDRLVDLIVNTDIAPMVDQVETHPFHQRVADQAFMREHGVVLESWGPFAEGRNNLFAHAVLTDMALPTAGRSPRSSCAGSSSAASSRSPSRCDRSGWPRTSTSSASP